MTSTPRTYAQIAKNLHAAGGETQAEATALVPTARLRRMSTKTLYHWLETLRLEGVSCDSMHDYDAVRLQMERLRALLLARPLPV